MTGRVGDGRRGDVFRGLVRVPNLYPGLLIRAGDCPPEEDQVETAIDPHDLSRPGHPITSQLK